ncbi:putative pumilio-like protein 8, chloroplastic [Sesbania bispinosa]|nr:putative pumilio-like protein 8, chloroplastic [Sesbania bispinosa]
MVLLAKEFLGPGERDSGNLKCGTYPKLRHSPKAQRIFNGIGVCIGTIYLLQLINNVIELMVDPFGNYLVPCGNLY